MTVGALYHANRALQIDRDRYHKLYWDLRRQTEGYLEPAMFTESDGVIKVEWPQGARGCLISREMVELFVKYRNERRRVA